jgi:hypothetical protein
MSVHTNAALIILLKNSYHILFKICSTLFKWALHITTSFFSEGQIITRISADYKDSIARTVLHKLHRATLQILRLRCDIYIWTANDLSRHLNLKRMARWCEMPSSTNAISKTSKRTKFSRIVIPNISDLFHPVFTRFQCDIIFSIMLFTSHSNEILARSRKLWQEFWHYFNLNLAVNIKPSIHSLIRIF